MVELIISNIATCIVAIIGSGLLVNKIQKRKGNAETDSIVLQQMNHLNESLQNANDKLTEQCNKLYDDVMVHRDEKIKLREETTKLKLQIQKERLYRCEKPCSKRTPPSEDATLNIDEK